MGRATELTAVASWAHRVRGSLLLAACGDALGAPFEGRTRIDPQAVDALLADPPQPLRWTDDTALMLVLADHLARHRGTIDLDELARGFAAEWSRDPQRGYGAGASRLFARISAGESWASAVTELFDGQGSYGNGAAMRVAPVGLLPGLTPPQVAELARRSAEVTHAHPLGQDGAAVQAVAVSLAATTPPDATIDPEQFVAAVAAQARTPEFAAALAQVQTLVAERAGPDRVAAQLGCGVRAVESVPAALVAFLHAPRQPRAVIRYAICLGGDTDTIAAMAAAIAGARCGEQSLPVLWALRLEAVARLFTVGSALGVRQ